MEPEGLNCPPLISVFSYIHPPHTFKAYIRSILILPSLTNKLYWYELTGGMIKVLGFLHWTFPFTLLTADLHIGKVLRNVVSCLYHRISSTALQRLHHHDRHHD
jgi:hypothetical protein